MALRCLVAAGLCGVIAGQQLSPQVIADTSNNVKINSPTDVVLTTGGTTCTSSAPCGLGASIGSLLSQTEAMSNGVPANLVSMSSASSMYASTSDTNNLLTSADANAMDAATRAYVDNEVMALANLSGNATSVALSAIIQAHRRLGILSTTGVFNGDLRIQGDAQLATVYDLVNHITAITGTLYVSGLTASSTFPTFTNLQTIGLDFYIQSSSGLTTLEGSMPSLTAVGRNMWVQSNNGLTNVNNFAPALTTINGSLGIRYNRALANLNGTLPALTTIGGNLQIASNSPNMPSSLGTAMPQLSSLGGANLNIPGQPPFNPGTMIYTGNLQGSFAAMTTAAGNARIIAGNVYIQSVTGTSIPTGFLSNVRVISGVVYVQRNTGLTSLDGLFNNLVSCGGVYIYLNSGLTSFGNAFQNLAMVNGYLQVRNNQNRNLVSLDGIFPQLTNVTSYCYVQYNYYVMTMRGAFPRLTWVNSRLYISYNRALSYIDNTTFPVLEYAGGVSIQRNYASSSNGLATLDNIFPSLLRVGSNGLYITYEYALISGTNMFPLLTQVGGSMYMYYNTAVSTLAGSCPLLSSVRYSFYVYNNYQLATVTGAFASMSSIGSTLSFYRNGCTSSTGICLQAFCTAMQGTLCPAANTYGTSSIAYNANACCSAYCSANSC